MASVASTSSVAREEERHGRAGGVDDGVVQRGAQEGSDAKCKECGGGIASWTTTWSFLAPRPKTAMAMARRGRDRNLASLALLTSTVSWLLPTVEAARVHRRCRQPPLVAKCGAAWRPLTPSRSIGRPRTGTPGKLRSLTTLTCTWRGTSTQVTLERPRFYGAAWASSRACSGPCCAACRGCRSPCRRSPGSSTGCVRERRSASRRTPCTWSAPAGARRCCRRRSPAHREG